MASVAVMDSDGSALFRSDSARSVGPVGDGTDDDATRCCCDDCLLGITDLLEATPTSNNRPALHVGIVSERVTRKMSRWHKLRTLVQFTPFVQTYRNKRYEWVQLAGHAGNFRAGEDQGTILKKLCAQEELCYHQFAADAIADYVPRYFRTLEVPVADKGEMEKFIQLQDCLSTFTSPSIMDCKIGVRTYLEAELAKAQEKPKLRKDMYDKMVAVDPAAPTQQEHQQQGVTKPRYMCWRETISSTATLGFRIEGIRKGDGTSSKAFKTTKTREQVMKTIQGFTSASTETAGQYLERLQNIKNALQTSQFFSKHELISSSLLFVHDAHHASVWMIDFGKTVPLPEDVVVDHKSAWVAGNHEDGYLVAIENLIDIFAELAAPQ